MGAVTGCLGAVPETGDGTTSPRETTPGSASPETTASAGRNLERNASPHEFVHVERVANQSVAETAAPDRTALFENLGPRRRRTFRAALERERVAADGWSYYNQSRPEYVRYDGTWFRVVIGVH